MATINFAFFFLTLSALLAAHHARLLNDVRFGRRPPLQAAPEVIQMVIGKEELQSPPSYGREKPKPPPSPKVAPPRGQATYGGDNPILAPPSPESAYGRDNTKVPPPPEVGPSRGQATYGGGDNPKLALPSSEAVPESDQGQTGYGREKLKAPPPPKPAPSRGEATYGGNNPTGTH